MNRTPSELLVAVQAIASDHHAGKVECRILKWDTMNPSPREVPDINVYDDHTVRYSTLQLGAGRMQSVVSENTKDVKERENLFEWLWDHGEPYPAVPPPASPSGA